jgi:UDP-N-acetylmuramate dehydrogenase
MTSQSLAKFTTFHLGGPCRELIHCQTSEELIKAVHALAGTQKKFILIGGGSNLVVSDDGVDCAVVRYFSKSPRIAEDDNKLKVTASTILDDLVLFAAEIGLSGINTCSGIPGTVGGAVVGNAGAFGKQIGDVVEKITMLSPGVGGAHCAPLREIEKKDLGFTYRHSNLKETNDIVVDVTLKMHPADSAELLKEREDILKLRREKHPELTKEPCAGSFFRNIEPSSSAGKRQATGWFLEKAGGKKLKSGGAYIFAKHANIIIKGKKCTAKDVYELSQKMAALAKKEFNLDLVREVRFVGKIPGMPADVTTIMW